MGYDVRVQNIPHWGSVTSLSMRARIPYCWHGEQSGSMVVPWYPSEVIRKATSICQANRRAGWLRCRGLCHSRNRLRYCYSSPLYYFL
jgi:hypothetical protein